MDTIIVVGIFLEVAIIFTAWVFGRGAGETYYKSKLSKGVAPEQISEKGETVFDAEVLIKYDNGKIEFVELKAGTTKKYAKNAG